MPPIRPEDHAYRFRPSMLRELREQLKLTQAQMADLLEIPVNTLSRWELGNNLPDANALAAIYSVAAERGVKPQFFEERRNTMSQFKKRKNRIIDWDFQNLGIDAENIEDIANDLIEYLDILCGPSNNDEQYAYGPGWGFEHSTQGQALEKAGFDIIQCYSNADRQIMDDGRRFFGLPSMPAPVWAIPVVPSSADGYGASDKISPKESAYVLISDDGDYAEYLQEIRKAGVETFVCGSAKCSQKLIRAVGQDHFIPFERPYVVLKCLEMVRELNGKAVNKAVFGDLCRRKLADDGLDLDDIDDIMEDTGFSLNRPYASVLTHMDSVGIAKVKQVGNDPNRITITEVKR